MTGFNFLSTVLMVFVFGNLCSGKDFYQLLGVSKAADSREIRKAFKKLALVLHPDKNIDDPNAQQKFLNLKQAYEVLKDQESRKTYDLYGENGLKDNFQRNREYQNWHFYANNFGIYDEDPEIITLSSSDFEQNVRNTFEFWFVKFYSPKCSHCHIMAPSWRELGLELNAVVKIAVVNCDEEWTLCRKEGISSYPTLVLYPSKEKYHGDRTSEEMQHFVLNKLPVRPVEILSYKSLQNILETEKTLPWLFITCLDSSDSCPSWQSQRKLAYFFAGLVSVGYVDCSSKELSCEKYGLQSGVVYLPLGISTIQQGIEIQSFDYLDIASQVLEQLPDAELMGQKDVEDLHGKLKSELESNWLIHFIQGNPNHTSFSTLQYRRLPALLPRLKFGRVNCDVSHELCSGLFVSKYPTFATYKKGGAVEILVGGTSVSEVVSFARNSIWAPNLETLTPSTFPTCLDDGHPWVIDFYVPWCPPCMRLIPEFRKASSLVGGIVKFGSLDCSVHGKLCSSFNIRSYPTVIFYNNSVPHQYTEQFTSLNIATFIEDIMRPPVIELTMANFNTLVADRPVSEIWVVDFFAPWCGPCIQLAPQWRQFARMVRPLKNIRVGSVDCVAQGSLCTQHAINSYPTIRLYPINKASNVVSYNSYQRDSVSIRNWLIGTLPPIVHSLTDHTFTEIVLKSSELWVIDFYAPWCGPCYTFGFEFELAARIMEGRVKFAKVDCDNFPRTCQVASIQAYPSVRYYGGRTGSSAQAPSGLYFQSVNRQAEDIVSWLEEQSSRQQQSSAFNHHPNRDEL